MVSYLVKKKRWARERGMTLIEVMIGTALSGIVFVALFTLLGKSGEFAGFFQGTASSIDAVSEAVSFLNSTMPNVIRVRTCTCRGSTSNGSAHYSNNMSHCYWHPSQPMYDPRLDASMAPDAGFGAGVTVFAGEYEHFAGGTNTMNTTQLLRSSIAGGGVSCINYTSLPSSQTRGCKRDLWIRYVYPTLESGSTPSNAGALWIHHYDGSTWYTQAIGPAAGVNQSLGSSGIGVTELSCGFEHDSSTFSVGSNRISQNFVLNFKIKARTNSINQVSHPLYSSWHRSGKNYHQGTFRDVKLKYSFRNQSNRGAYFWKATSIRNCKRNGQSAASKEECCSLASNGSSCIACVPAGSAGTNSSCCSEKAVSGVCQ